MELLKSGWPVVTDIVLEQRQLHSKHAMSIWIRVCLSPSILRFSHSRIDKKEVTEARDGGRHPSLFCSFSPFLLGDMGFKDGHH